MNKVPQVTAVFRTIKILSTTVGETGADDLAVHAGLGIAVTGGMAVAAATTKTARVDDLGPFRAIAVDTAALVDKGDLPGAKASIKGLEIAWNDTEPSMNPRAAAKWHTIDKAINRALATSRATFADS
jgi:hypothetical protein